MPQDTDVTVFSLFRERKKQCQPSGHFDHVLKSVGKFLYIKSNPSIYLERERDLLIHSFESRNLFL